MTPSRLTELRRARVLDGRDPVTDAMRITLLRAFDAAREDRDVAPTQVTLLAAVRAAGVPVEHHPRPLRPVRGEAFTREEIVRARERHGTLDAAARALGTTRQTFTNYLDRYGLRRTP